MHGEKSFSEARLGTSRLAALVGPDGAAGSGRPASGRRSRAASTGISTGSEATARHSGAARDRFARSEEPQCTGKPRRTAVLSGQLPRGYPTHAGRIADAAGSLADRGADGNRGEADRGPENGAEPSGARIFQSGRQEDPDSGRFRTRRTLLRFSATRQSSVRGRKAGRTGPAKSANPARRLSNLAADDGPEPADHDDGRVGFRRDAHGHGRRTRAPGGSHQRDRAISRGDPFESIATRSAF